MNQNLAEQILTQVLGWELKEAKENVRLLEEFAELKYDQYQQYEAGNRFMESLAVWLNQFQPLVENAVKHGICGREDGGTLTLHTHREGNEDIKS